LLTSQRITWSEGLPHSIPTPSSRFPRSARCWSGTAKASGNYTARRFTQFRRRQGCTRDGLSFHSLRKNFVTAAEDAGVPDTTIAAIVGHKGRRGFTLSKYAPKPRLRLLVAAIGKVQYKGLKLS